jgi:hypothetical protein
MMLVASMDIIPFLKVLFVRLSGLASTSPIASIAVVATYCVVPTFVSTYSCIAWSVQPQHLVLPQSFGSSQRMDTCLVVVALFVKCFAALSDALQSLVLRPMLCHQCRLNLPAQAYALLLSVCLVSLALCHQTVGCLSHFFWWILCHHNFIFIVGSICVDVFFISFGRSSRLGFEERFHLLPPFFL